MKKAIIIVILTAAVILVIGICIRRIVRKDDVLCTVTYRSKFGYSLSMTANGGHITVTYIDDGKDPVVKDVDVSCYANVVGILETYDFASWKDLTVNGSKAEDLNTLEIGYESGKTLLFSQSRELPEKAYEMFSAINTCLMEYAGILK